MITKREAAIISAYTGTSFGAFSDMHEYVEEILQRPIWTHQMASKELWAEIKLKAKPDFVALSEAVNND
jgi:hypothetical protein